MQHIQNSTLNDTHFLSSKMHTSTHVQKGDFKNLFGNESADKQKMRQSQIYEGQKIHQIDKNQSSQQSQTLMQRENVSTNQNSGMLPNISK